jgi:poly(hydroxyalkanoate) depolymerase family esterase
MRLALSVLGLLIAAPTATGAPEQVDDFGPNPGDLEMWAYSPAGAPDRAPLLVVLHGCTQQATSMAPGGFEALADELGFHVLYPQQEITNNPARCFNWFDSADLVRGEGENQSIVSMVEAMKSSRSIDPARVYVIGFSAGGGMAAVLLATWPDVFAAGAIGAGVPYRCATSQLTAFDCMNLSLNPERKRSPSGWGDLVRAAHPGWDGPWPRVMMVHGAGDTTVDPDAALELVEQWTDVHGIDADADRSDEIGGHQRTRFVTGGAVVVESWLVNGMGHAIPIDPDKGCGQVAAYFEDHDLCAARIALDFFALGSGGDGNNDAGAGAAADAGGSPAPSDDDGGGGGCSTGGGAGAGGGLLLAVLIGRGGRRWRRSRSSPGPRASRW